MCLATRQRLAGGRATARLGTRHLRALVFVLKTNAAGEQVLSPRHRGAGTRGRTELYEPSRQRLHGLLGRRWQARRPAAFAIALAFLGVVVRFSDSCACHRAC